MVEPKSRGSLSAVQGAKPCSSAERPQIASSARARGGGALQARGARSGPRRSGPRVRYCAGATPHWSHDPGCGAASGERAGKRACSGGAYRLLSRAPPCAAQGKARGRSQRIRACSTAQRPGRATAARRCQLSQLGNCPRARRATELISVRARGGGAKTECKRRRASKRAYAHRAAARRRRAREAAHLTYPRAGHARGTRLRKPAREGMTSLYRRSTGRAKNPLASPAREKLRRVVESSAAPPRSPRGRTRLPSPRARRTARVARKQEGGAHCGCATPAARA